MKILFHCHTSRSKCSNINEHDLISYLNKYNFNCVIVTDHDEITRIQWKEGVVIPAVEISTAEGDLIGVFVSTKIPQGLSIERTAKLIHEQGGVVIAPHPLDKFRSEAMGQKTFIKNLKNFDIVESNNSRNLSKKANRKAQILAAKNKLPVIYGADAHTLNELDNVSIEMPAFSNSREFIESIKRASFNFKPAGILPHIKTFIIKRTWRR